MKDARNLDKIRLYGFDIQEDVMHNTDMEVHVAEATDEENNADYRSAAEAFADFVGIQVDAVRIVHDEQEQSSDNFAESAMDDVHTQRMPIPPLRPGPEPIRPPVHPVPPGHVRPHPMPTPSPTPKPTPRHPSGSAPRFAPPAFIPQAAPGLRAVDPGAIAGCLYSFTYLWLSNRSQFWFFPTFVGRRSVSGYRWIRGSWVFMGFDLRLIDSFFCGGR